MIKLQRLHVLCFLLLLPCVLFGALAEFFRDLKAINVFSAAGLGGETAESEETTLLVSENLLLYSQPLTQSRNQNHKLWRQFLALIICVLLLKALSKLTLQNYYHHNYFPEKFFHGLLISLLLGGRAPPRSA